MVTKTPFELSEMTPEEKKAHFASEERIVFGHDLRRDRHGEPLERGLGAPGHRTENHYRALGRAEGVDAEKAARAADAAKGKPAKGARGVGA